MIKRQFNYIKKLLNMLLNKIYCLIFFFSSKRRHTISLCDWSSDVCSSDLAGYAPSPLVGEGACPDRGIGARSRQIGRASCRERVEISVEVEKLKKKGRVNGFIKTLKQHKSMNISAQLTEVTLDSWKNVSDE